MALRINGPGAVQTYRLQQRDQQLALSLTRLSSGSKLNRAADGPAALMINNQLRTQLEALGQATDNITQGIGMARTAEGGLEQIQDLLQQQRNLAVQAQSSATVDADQLKALDKQFQSLGKAIDSLASGTQYAGTKLLDGSFTGRQIQTGQEAGQTVELSITSSATGTPAGFDQAGLGTSGQSLLGAGGATAALEAIDKALTDVGQQRGALGALEANSLDSLRNSLAETSANLAGARSTIGDVDYAEEFAGLVRNQILMQSAIAARAQQNVSAGSVMKLLGA